MCMFFYLLSQEKDREVYEIEKKNIYKETKRFNYLENRKWKQESNSDWRQKPEVKYVDGGKSGSSRILERPLIGTHHKVQL